MKIHKEIVWNKGVNPKEDGEYLFVRFYSDGSVSYTSLMGYTVQHGWNTYEHECRYSMGQNPNNGAYAWAKVTF